MAQLVARYLGVVEAASSSLVTQTKIGGSTEPPIFFILRAFSGFLVISPPRKRPLFFCSKSAQNRTRPHVRPLLCKILYIHQWFLTLLGFEFIENDGDSLLLRTAVLSFSVGFLFDYCVPIIYRGVSIYSTHQD